MASIKISQLPAKGANLASTDLVEISEFTGTGYISKSITGQEIIDAASGGSGVTDVTASAPLSSSGGTTPDISLPQADAGTDGYLSTTDFINFTNKQEALVSGTNIKTLNGASLLGSGGLSVQPTLVSGTNIKTINGNTLLGSGDLTISGGATKRGLWNFNLITGKSFGIIPHAITSTTYTTSATITNTIYLAPILFTEDTIVTSFEHEITGVSVGGSFKFIIFSDTNGVPDSKLMESTLISTTTTGFKTYTNTFTFSAGVQYWIGNAYDIICTARAIANTNMRPFTMGATGITTGYTYYRSIAYTPTTIPSTMPFANISLTNSAFPAIKLYY